MSHASSPSSQKNSTYQLEFGEKRQKVFDSRELDCRQDKIRNLKINFMSNRVSDWNHGTLLDAKKVKAKKNKG